MSKFYNLIKTNDDSSDEESVLLANNKIFGENGTAQFVTSGNKLLDIYGKSTRLTVNKENNEHLIEFIKKLDNILTTETNEITLDNVKYFVANGFYMRDVKEKGERTLFYLFVISLWSYDSELCKKLFKFIVGNQDSETYFGSWKDLTQILLICKKLGYDNTKPKQYSEMYNFILEFICDQLEIDFTNLVDYKANQSNQTNQSNQSNQSNHSDQSNQIELAHVKPTKPKISLCAKWLVSSDKNLDLALKFNNKDFVANFCAVNTNKLIQMNKMGRSLKLNEEWNNRWKKVKPSDFIGLQRALRKIKSSLNEYLETVEVFECSNKWSEIKFSSVPAKHMTKRRRAFNNEKSAKDRPKSYYDTSIFQFGDKFDKPFNELVPDEEIRNDILKLSLSISNKDFQNLKEEFVEKYVIQLQSNANLRKVIDRILCRINLSASLVKANRTIHGARSDINDLVKTALNFDNSAKTPFDPNKIAEWAPSNPERALLHRQMDDKIKEISDAIDLAMKVQADAEQQGESDIASSAKKIYINLKKTVGLYDVSGSMESAYGSHVRPIDVCIGLAYCISKLTANSVENRVPFGITFHETPSIFTLPQSMDFVSACFNIKGQAWGGSTNFEAAFKLILDRAVKENWLQDDMPDVLMVISDMQFNSAGCRNIRSETMFETVKREFEKNGYQLPLLVFWNVNGAYAGQNVTSNIDGVISLSGYDPALMKTIAECGSLVTKDATGKMKAINPMEVMINSLTRPKYQQLLETVETHYSTNTIVQRQALIDNNNETSKYSDGYQKLIDNGIEILHGSGARL
jgi:hypothetical protein